jgi:hypothetical protein
MGARDAIAKLLTGIKAYHSSPHDFERFDLSKIGTGEGAQVYGHGLYFAENPAVSGQGGQYWNQFLRRFGGPEGVAARTLGITRFDREKAIDAVKASIGREQALGTTPEQRWMQERMQALGLLESGQPVGPRTYEVNIKADPAQFLDWDKPLKEQSATQQIVPPSVYGSGGKNFGSAYKEWQYSHGVNPMTITNTLQEAGIPGIKYLDEGSRPVANEIALYRKQLESPGWPDATRAMMEANLAQWEAKPITSNYVVFDPSNVDILKKYGVVGAPAGALTMGALAGQDQYEAPP